MRLAMKTLSRAILGAHRIASALLLSGFVLCNFGAQADVSYSKVGVWSVAYLEVGNLNGCRAAAQFPDQTIFQMVQLQSGTDKAWIVFISNPRWNAWIGKRTELRLQLVTDWPVLCASERTRSVAVLILIAACSIGCLAIRSSKFLGVAILAAAFRSLSCQSPRGSGTSIEPAIMQAQPLSAFSPSWACAQYRRNGIGHT
jgi:hypothetical protein